MKTNNKIFFIFVITILLFTISCTNKTSINQAKRLIKENKYLEAISILESIDKKNTDTYFLLGEAYSGIRKFAIADSFYSIVLKQKPSMKTTIIKKYSSIALTDFMKGYTFSAIIYWNKILEIDPSYDINIGFYYLGEYQYNQKNYDYAKSLLLNALNVSLPSKEKISTYRMIIDIYKNEALFDSALIYAQKADGEFKNPTNPDDDFSIDIGELTYKIAEQKYQMKDYDSALNLINKFIAIQKPLSFLDDAYLILGNIYFELKDDENAIKAYKKVIELNDVKLYGSRDTYEKANLKLKLILERSRQ